MKSTLRKELEAALILDGSVGSLKKITDVHSPGDLDAAGALPYAALRANAPCVRLLIDAGCDINAHIGATALSEAVNKGNVDLVGLLLSSGADPNVPGMRLLFGAIRNEQGNGLVITKLLVEHGIDFNETFVTWDDVRKSPLDWAAQCPEIAAYLQGVGAKSAEELLGKQQTAPVIEEDEVGRDMSNRFGPIDENAIMEIVSKDPPISVRMIRPNPRQDCLTLFTGGMSLAPMSVKKKDEDYAFAELFIQLPPDWPTDGHSLQDAKFGWPIEWLRNIARYPHHHSASLEGPFTIVTYADSDRTLSPGNGFSAVLVAAEFAVERDDGAVIHLYRLTPLYTEEVELQREEGMKGLADAFDRKAIPRVVDLGRPNAAVD